LKTQKHFVYVNQKSLADFPQRQQPSDSIVNRLIAPFDEMCFEAFQERTDPWDTINQLIRYRIAPRRIAEEAAQTPNEK
jgi:hypothetical protein